MNKLIGGTKNKNLLFFAATASAILVTAVFLIIASMYNKQKKEIPIALPDDRPSKEMIEAATVPREGEEQIPVSKEIIRSLTASDADMPSSADGSKKNKTIQPSPVPVSKEQIRNLTLPNK
jgi:hypothetical protein